MRILLISLGVTCLASVILFLYFRNRIGRMEQKLDLMFQLIQEYEQNKNMRTNVAPNMTTIPIKSEPVDNLISVSDDEEEDYTDSDEVSDDDEEEIDSLNIEASHPIDNVKSISLSGAEIESLCVEHGDDLDEISDMDESDNLEVDNEEIEVEKKDNDVLGEEMDDIHIKNLDDAKPFQEMTVKELKAKAEEKGFNNYKGLRKDKLVELLTSID
uniref:Rho termination factor N-terminal domain-containing protein n=1 Tax=viral metagenome TaxID=1070528 RepID=A0A6C0C3R5_9ZZZZ